MENIKVIDYEEYEDLCKRMRFYRKESRRLIKENIKLDEENKMLSKKIETLELRLSSCHKAIKASRELGIVEGCIRTLTEALKLKVEK